MDRTKMALACMRKMGEHGHAVVECGWVSAALHSLSSVSLSVFKTFAGASAFLDAHIGWTVKHMAGWW